MQRLAELRREAEEDFRQADAAMQTAYRRLLDFVKGPERARLQEAQAAWQRFCDANAAFEAEFLHDPKSGALYRLGAKARLCEARTKHLTDQFEARKAR